MNADSVRTDGPSSQQRGAEILRPPGFAGVISDYLYEAAPRPNREAATAGAIGLLAGINGGAYTVSKPRSGLNLYIALLMKSAIGKESMSRATQLYKDAMKVRPQLIPWASNLSVAMDRRYLLSTRSASGPALTRELAENPCHAKFMGEIGLFLQQLCAAQADSHLHELKRLILDLYEKSGPGQEIGGITYSKSDNNIDDIVEPAFSLVGDTTPESFYRALTDDAENGFLSRWTVIERKSFERPDRNESPTTDADRDLLGAIAWMVSAAELFRARGRIAIESTGDAKELLDEFDGKCDLAINGSSDNAVRAVYNRSFMKVYRLSGLLAVGDFAGWNWWADCNGQSRKEAPVIDAEHVRWATGLEELTIEQMTARISGGESGSGDDSRRRKVLAVLKDWFTPSNAVPSEFKRLEKFRGQGIIPWRYLVMRTQKLGAFKDHKLGSTNALRMTIESLKKEGVLRHLPETLKDELSFGAFWQGECYLWIDKTDAY